MVTSCGFLTLEVLFPLQNKSKLRRDLIVCDALTFWSSQMESPAKMKRQRVSHGSFTYEKTLARFFNKFG